VSERVVHLEHLLRPVLSVTPGKVLTLAALIGAAPTRCPLYLMLDLGGTCHRNAFPLPPKLLDALDSLDGTQTKIASALHIAIQIGLNLRARESNALQPTCISQGRKSCSWRPCTLYSVHQATHPLVVSPRAGEEKHLFGPPLLTACSSCLQLCATLPMPVPKINPPVP
jgi:hypothetical protein